MVDYIYGHEAIGNEKLVCLHAHNREVEKYKGLAEKLYKALKMQTPEAEYESEEELEECIKSRSEALVEAEEIL